MKGDPNSISLIGLLRPKQFLVSVVATLAKLKKKKQLSENLPTRWTGFQAVSYE